MQGKINTQTQLYAVFGNPVGHSLSPIMLNRAFEEVGFNGVYLACRVTDIHAAMAAVRTLGIQGVSITIPHKITVMETLDEVDPQALKIGAVNTVVNQGGRLYGYNSDGTGAVRALMEKTIVQGADIAVIGAGGAARAIGFCLQENGGRVMILNRSHQRGENLARDLGADFIPLGDLKEIPARILINTTPVGMSPDTEDMPLPPQLLHKEMLVMDIVYNPLETALLKYAKTIGCETIDGVAMFVYQGAIQFSLWTGLQAPVTAMRRVVLDELTAQAQRLGQPK